MHQGFDVGDMRQREDTAAVDVLIMRHVPRDHREPHIDPPEKGLDLGHLGHLAGGGDEIDADQLEITTPLSLIVAPASGLQTAIGRVESYLIDPDGHVLWQLENIEAALKDLYELAESATGAAASTTSFPWDPRLHWESSFLDSLRNAESNLLLLAEQMFA
ncbi:hypothetical protein LCGC14_2913700, partial [marine sediment metagenome]